MFTVSALWEDEYSFSAASGPVPFRGGNASALYGKRRDQK